MPVIIDYILKLSICLAVVHLFYQLLLRRLTFYGWNRWYLLGYSMLSFIIPLIDIMPELQKKELDRNALVQLIPVFGFSSAATDPSFFESLTTWDWVLLIAALGSLILLARFLIMFCSFLRIKRKAQLISDDRTRIYQLDEDMRPFSFGNAIFINTELHSGEELEEIIRHEFVHVKQKHTLDIIWSELLCILLWFNPFVWLLRKSIKQNLEFLADKQVLQNGMDKKEYQYLLLKVMGNKQFAFTNHFNFSSLKNRIAMMNTLRSARVHLAKFLFLLPVVAVLLLAFRKEVLREVKKEAGSATTELPAKATGSLSETIQKELQLALIPKDTTPSKPGQKKYYVVVANAGFSKNIKDPADIVTRMRRSEWDANKEKYEREYGHAPAAKMHLSQDGERDFGFDSVYVMRRSPRTAVSVNPPLYIVDGKELDSKKGLSEIDANTIQSISVLKDNTAEKLYGEKGRNGVVIITTKKEGVMVVDSSNRGNIQLRLKNTDDTLLTPELRLHGAVAGVRITAKNANGTVSPDGNGVVHTESAGVAFERFDGVYLLDGKMMDKAALKNINSEKIKSINVFKNDKAREMEYGEKAKNGVIEIHTNDEKSDKAPQPAKKPDEVVVVGYGVKRPLQEVIVTGYGTRQTKAAPAREGQTLKLIPVEVKGYKKEAEDDKASPSTIKSDKPAALNLKPAKIYKFNLAYTATLKPAKVAVTDTIVFRSR